MNPACDHAQMTARNQELVREFFATLSTDAGLTKGGDAVIDDFLTPVRGMFAPGDPKIHVKHTFSDGDIFGAETGGSVNWPTATTITTDTPGSSR